MSCGTCTALYEESRCSDSAPEAALSDELIDDDQPVIQAAAPNAERHRCASSCLKFLYSLKCYGVKLKSSDAGFACIAVEGKQSTTDSEGVSSAAKGAPEPFGLQSFIPFRGASSSPVWLLVK
eukprot:1761020-Amphidinium_carterae.1